MKHLFYQGLLSLLLCAVFCISASAGAPYDFKVKNSDGVMIYYSIIKRYNQSENTVKVCRKNGKYDHNTYIGDVTVPATVEYKGVTYKVVDINNAFNYCKELTSVTLPDDITPLKDVAFSGCRNLKSVNIPSSQKIIGVYTFYDCNSLESIKIPLSVTNIGEGAFCGCKSLSSIELPVVLDSIGKKAFKDCSGLASITIPPSVKKISEEAFSGCTSLAKVEIDVNNIDLKNDVFAKCPYQDEYNVAMSKKKQALLAQEKERKAALAAQKAEQERKKRSEPLYKIISGNTVEVTSGRDYAGDIIIPETVTIEGKTYKVTRIGMKAFYQCDEVNSVIMPGSIQSIERSAFANCSNMCVVNIPASVQIIGETAFSGCI